jgi:heme exporter protein CcmD
MDWSSAHAGFVAAAYALSAAVLLALTIFILARDRANRHRIGELEARGAPRRRSDKR